MTMDDRQTSRAKGRKAAMRAFVALVVFGAIAAFVFILSPSVRYDWVKAIHVIAVISWMAGLLYLPRLFVYHSDSELGSGQYETFCVMERRLLKIIMTPAMLVAWALGLWLTWTGGHWYALWFWGKLLAVLVMTIAHFYLSAGARGFAEKRNEKTARHWRIVNEIPTLAMIAAVILVIVKPF